MSVKISPFGTVNKIWEEVSENKVIGVILVSIGLVLGGYGYLTLQKGLAPKGWKQAEGTIVHSNIDEKWVSVNAVDGNVIWKKQYSPDVAYTYVANNKKYRAAKINRYKDWMYLKKEAKRIIKKYPKWIKVPVYYNLQKPQEALLEPNPVILDFFVLFLGGMFCLFGLFALIKK